MNKTINLNKKRIFEHSEGYFIYKTKNGEEFIFDKEDYDLIISYSWYIGKRGYVTSSSNKVKHTMLHRLLLKTNNKDEIVDHINHNILDNRKSNLRICNKSQNNGNQIKTRGTSKYKGVSWIKVKNKWLSQISHLNKHYFLGYFNNEKDAAIAYNNKATEFFKEFAYLNNIEE